MRFRNDKNWLQISDWDFGMETDFGMKNNGSIEFERKLGEQIYTPSHIRIRREQFKIWLGSRDMKKMIL